MSVLLSIALVSFAAMHFMMGVVRLIEGHFPLWYFRLFVAWWWPFRGESAATLAAAALDADQGATEWSVSHGYSRAIELPALRASVTLRRWCSEPSLRVEGETVPMSAWDTYALETASNRWIRRHDRAERQLATFKAAERIATNLRGLKRLQ